MAIAQRLLVVLTFMTVFGVVFYALALWVVHETPTPENRPAPPERMADREAARVATLSKIAARHRGSV